MLFLVTAALSAAATAACSPSWHWRNYGHAKPFSPVGQDVTIQVPPDTDIWRPATEKDNFTAPFLYTTIPTSKFKNVQVTVTGPWKTLYDQGGLVVSFPTSKINATRSIKAGIEFTDGAPALGVVGTDILSDWSLSPIVDSRTARHATATILIERDGTDAWVYVLEGLKKKRRSLRQVTWAFNKDDGQGIARDMEVGIYGAKPTREQGEGHEFDKIPVSFSGFVLNTADGPVN